MLHCSNKSDDGLSRIADSRWLEQVGHAPVVARRNPKVLPEESRKMTRRREAKAVRYFTDGLGAVGQPINRRLEAQGVGINQRRDLRIAPKERKKMRPG